MEELSRFDVAEYNGVFMVVIESDLFPPEPAAVVAHLPSNYQAVKYLNRVLAHESKRLVLAMHLIAAVRRSNLRRAGKICPSAKVATCVDALIARGFFGYLIARSGADMCPAFDAAFDLPRARMVFECQVQIKPTYSRALCRKLVFLTSSQDRYAKLPKTSLAPPSP
jgi:toxin CcdB